jgi:hypothetical protein
VHFLHDYVTREKNLSRDLLIQDFEVIYSMNLPRPTLPSFSIMPNLISYVPNDFTLKVYAPYVFKFLRSKFSLSEIEFMVYLNCISKSTCTLYFKKFEFFKARTWRHRSDRDS